MTSAHPATASKHKENHSVSVSPNTVIAPPHTATAMITVQPCRRRCTTKPVVSAPNNAPTPGAAYKNPRVIVPPWKDSQRHRREQGARHAEHHRVDVDHVDALQRLTGAQVAQALLGGLPHRHPPASCAGGIGCSSTVSTTAATKETASSP